MKKNIILIVLLISTALLFDECKNNSTGPQNSPNSSDNYFPNTDGTYYKYSVVRTDSSGTQTSGTRSATYSGTTKMGSVTYQNEIDTISIGIFSAISTSLFLKNSSGVYFAIDTTGLSQTIPDSLKQYIQMDATINIFQFPFTDGQTWPVFNMSLKFGSISFNLVKVVAYYKGIEPLTLNLTSGTVTQNAAKIQYNLILSIPNLSNPFAPPTTSSYTAYAWVVNNIGVAQVQGTGTILDAFTGGGINFADTTSIVSQSLISYSIK